MIRRIVAGAVVLLAATPWVLPTSPTPAPPSGVVAAAWEARGRPLPERIGVISAQFVGADYVLDAAGEGGGPDGDPPSRYDAFDCVTFVEEVLSLALAGDPSDAGRIRDALRYVDGTRGYGTRNHFMELQWLPNNSRDGWIRDVTASIGPARTLEAAVTAATWTGWSKRSLFQLTDDELPVGTMRLDVLPPAAMLAAIGDVPEGAIVLTVREPRAGVPIWTNHVGLTVPAPTPTLRHASKTGDGRVRDQGLAAYVQTVATTYKNWPAAGFAVFVPLEQGPRATRPGPNAGIGIPPTRSEDL